MKFTIERRSKLQRKRERQDAPLQIIKPTTAARYATAVGLFFEFLRVFDIAYPADKISLDSIVTRWLIHLYHEGDPAGTAGDGLSGLQHFLPSLRRNLNGSWRVFKAWRAHELPAQAPPFPELVLNALVGLALSLDLPGLAASLALGFHCCLRSGEIFSLLAEHVVCDRGAGAVILPKTKKGIRDCVAVDSSRVAHLCFRRLLSLKPFESVIGLSPASARTRLKQLLEVLGLERFAFRWYSVRRGGATAQFRAHGQMEKILVRGRWESSRTARIYLTDGVGALASVLLSEDERSGCAWLASSW